MPQSLTTAPFAGETENNDVVFVSRQPIYDRSFNRFAYELVAANDVVEQTLFANPVDSNSESFLNTFLDVGLKPLIGDNLGFITVTRMFILLDYCKAFPKEKVVVGLPRNLVPDSEILTALKDLRSTGYALAIDDFRADDPRHPFLELAGYVKLDSRLLADTADLKTMLPVGFKRKLIATNIETEEGFSASQKAGCEYFHGPCFSQPKTVKATRVPVNRLATLRLIHQLQQPVVSMEQLEKLVIQDVSISFKLLRYVNSASLGISRNIQSIKHAIQMVGTERIRAWASQLLLSSFDDKPRELTVTAFIRGQMAHRLAMAQKLENADACFMVGLFSVVDALLDLDMSTAMDLLPLSKPIRDALVSHEGPMGSILSCVLDYEAARWDEVRGSGLDPEMIRRCYLEAVAASLESVAVTG